MTVQHAGLASSVRVLQVVLLYYAICAFALQNLNIKKSMQPSGQGKDVLGHKRTPELHHPKEIRRRQASSYKFKLVIDGDFERAMGLNDSEKFRQSVTSDIISEDFFYAILGDTQHWFRCTSENSECWAATGNCNPDTGTQALKVQCIQKQSDWANTMAQRSVLELQSFLVGVSVDSLKANLLKGLVINGDLTDFGHDHEKKQYVNYWDLLPKSKSLKVFPGLGNHDYANNANQCTLNNCITRMLEYFVDYVQNNIKTVAGSFDHTEIRSMLIRKKHTGSLAYAWEDCAQTNPQRCVRFLQMNNYPTYAVKADAIFNDWNVQPSLAWLSNQLTKLDRTNKSIVINFHDIDTAFGDADKQLLINTLANYKDLRILAIFFAHIHGSVGLREYWCINGKRVPLLYSGSVPGGNYLLVGFNPLTGTLRKVYQFHVNSISSAMVEGLDIAGGTAC